MAATAAGGALSAYGQYQQGKTSNQIAQNNATMAGYAATEAQRQGELQSQQAQRQAAMQQGATRNRLAANGVDLGVGTAGELQANNDYFGEVNAANARTNAGRQAYGYDVQAQNDRAQGAAAQQQGTLGAFGTVLGTAGSVSGRWYSMTTPNSGMGTYPQMG